MLNPVNPTRLSAPAESIHPNFPACVQEGFTLTLEAIETHHMGLIPLRARSGSGKLLPIWNLVCRTESGALAGGCAVSFPGHDDAPSPRHLPHPVLGEWISALRYTGHAWMECGAFEIAAGFPEGQTLDLLWDGLQRLMHRNGVGFLVGMAPADSLALEVSVRRGVRLLEPHSPNPQRYFLFVE